MLILASQSPRRKALLESKNIEFKTVPSAFDEASVLANSPIEYVKTLARLKAKSILEHYPNDVILGADTIVLLDQTILGKPKDEHDAFLMLKMLRGKRHLVYTAVSIMNKDKEETWLSYAEVQFKDVSDQDILSYVKTKEPLDKAGSYGIQGLGSFLVASYYGNYHAIMGLPIDEVVEKLKQFS
ncbi:MAG: Maf family protein [Acholeplasmataceae bacterium]